MDKKETKTNKNNKIVDERIRNKDYGYDFIPTLNSSLNIDEQKVKAKRLENIEKKRGK